MVLFFLFSCTLQRTINPKAISTNNTVDSFTIYLAFCKSNEDTLEKKKKKRSRCSFFDGHCVGGRGVPVPSYSSTAKCCKRGPDQSWCCARALATVRTNGALVHRMTSHADFQ